MVDDCRADLSRSSVRRSMSVYDSVHPSDGSRVIYLTTSSFLLKRMSRYSQGPYPRSVIVPIIYASCFLHTHKDLRCNEHCRIDAITSPTSRYQLTFHCHLWRETLHHRPKNQMRVVAHVTMNTTPQRKQLTRVRVDN